MNYTSSYRREALEQSRGVIEWRPESRYAQISEKFGVEREADVDMVISAKARITADLNLTRWNGHDDVKAAIWKARAALEEAFDAMYAVRGDVEADIERRYR